MLYENPNMTVDNEGIYSGLTQQLNGQTIFHEKAKSLTQNHFQRSTNENSDHKKQTLIQQQQLQQLSPDKMKALIQMTKLIKNSSKEQIAEP